MFYSISHRRIFVVLRNKYAKAASFILDSGIEIIKDTQEILRRFTADYFPSRKALNIFAGHSMNRSSSQWLRFCRILTLLIPCCGRLAQMDRALVSGTKGPGFESRIAYHSQVRQCPVKARKPAKHKASGFFLCPSSSIKIH